MIKKSTEMSISPRLVLMWVGLAAFITIIVWIAYAYPMAEKQNAPVAAAHTVMEGDVLTIHVAAPEVSDLYGYQFRLEYDDTSFAVDGLQSLISDIPTIFKKDFDGYVLVGATMTGDAPGYSASDTQLCEVKLTALADGVRPEVKLSKVSVVSSQLDYTEDITGWTYEVTAENALD